MTREEALDILTHNWTRLENPNYEESELDKAYYMAIEALSAEAEWIPREHFDVLKKNYDMLAGLLVEAKADMCSMMTLWKAR